MSNSGKQSPLGVNSLSGLLQNTGLNINPTFAAIVGTSSNVNSYTDGTVVNNTILNKITQIKNLAYAKLGTNASTEVNVSVYTNLLNLGSATIPALGNTDPASYVNVNTATATDGTTEIITCTSTANMLVNNVVVFTGTGFGGISAATYYWVNSIVSTTEFTISASSGGSILNLSTATGSMTIRNYASDQYGFIAKIALQAYNEFDYNDGLPSYADFLQSFMTCYNYIAQTNSTIATLVNSQTFLQGTYSNMNDLITSDITGVNLATLAFGQDFINTGKAINLVNITDFGMPSNLLKTLQTTNALTKSVSLAIIMSGITTSELGQILGNIIVPTPDQERKLYDAYEMIVGDDLADVLTPLNTNTLGLEKLSDLLDISKLFPNSYTSMTVPVYNTTNAPTNSKIYFPIYTAPNAVNSQLTLANPNQVNC
jgi:hypothetical protein